MGSNLASMPCVVRFLYKYVLIKPGEAIHLYIFLQGIFGRNVGIFDIVQFMIYVD